MIGSVPTASGRPQWRGAPAVGFPCLFEAAARIDRIADLLLQQGRVEQAEILSHQAAKLRQAVPV
jgi:hypothetical protein